MRKQLRRILLAITAAALAIGLAAPAAVASTWTVSPGGTSTSQGKLTVSVGGTDIECTVSITVVFQSGSGTHLGKITAVKFTDCTGPLSVPFTVTAEGLPWWLNAVSESSGVITVTITGIRAMVAASDCALTVGGTSATSGGQVPGTYTNSTSELTLLSGGTLHAFDVNGCLGVVQSGDAVGISGSVTIKPAQKISPA